VYFVVKVINVGAATSDCTRILFELKSEIILGTFALGVILFLNLHISKKWFFQNISF
jgi:hypothetical protein